MGLIESDKKKFWDWMNCLVQDVSNGKSIVIGRDSCWSWREERVSYAKYMENMVSRQKNEIKEVIIDF